MRRRGDDREGLLVTSEGALVRFLRAAPKNPLVMSSTEREQVGHAFGQLAGRLQPGQSLQFYVEAAPIRLDALLTLRVPLPASPLKASGGDHGMDMPASLSAASVLEEMPKSVSAGRL